MENEIKDVAEKHTHTFSESLRKHISDTRKTTLDTTKKYIKQPGLLIPKITKRRILLGIFIVISTIVLTFLIAWLVLKITTPESFLYSIVHLNFDVYAGIMLLSLAVLVIYDLLQIVLGFYENKLNKKRFSVVNATLILIILGIFVGSYVLRHPTLESNYPDYGEELIDYSKPVEVVFNLPVKVSELNPNIVPNLQGKWVWEPYLGLQGISRVGHFYPETSAIPDERFILYITGISKLTDPTQHEYGFVFQAPSLPRIVRTIPKDLEENTNRSEPIVLQVNKDSRDMVDWSFNIVPSIEYDVELTEDNQIKIIPKTTLSQGVKYSVEIFYRTKTINIESKEVLETGEIVEVDGFSFTTAKEPLIDTFLPTGSSVKPTDRISIVFSEEMNRNSVEENIVIEPEIEGVFEWTDDKHFIYKHDEDLSKDQQYKVTLKAGMKSKFDGMIETESIYEFQTAGRVKMVWSSPSGGSANVSEYTDIRIQFNQEVDQTSVAERFRINPALPGNISWENNTLIYRPTQTLSFETVYEVKITAGVRAIYGVDSNEDMSFTFGVRSNVFVFNIPLFYQPEGSFSCNIYTAKMILAWKGFDSNATGLISEIGYDANRSGNSWTGNPYTEYVGNADGSWGYGVYYQPIQRIFSNRGISSEAKVGWNVSELAQQVQQGRPVVIWRYNGVSSGNDISWTSDDGTYIKAFSGMHGGVVSGFMGPATNPTHLYVNDPWFGQFWMDVGTFNYYWSFTNNMAVIVY